GSVKINGENAVLRVTTTVWGTENVGVTFIKGEAHFTLEGDGVPGFDMAAFSGSTNLDISAGFKLYVTHYHKIVNFFGNPCNVNIANGTIYAKDIAKLNEDTFISSEMIAEESEQKK
ncbi:MAG: hypothetical protein OSJ83_13790, partial [Clostridia bacterium]|nr:hypothetical protein [Clostridia bacterium]